MAPRPGEIYDEGSLRASVGFGVGWESPFGPIGVDLSQAVLKEDFDKEEVFRTEFRNQILMKMMKSIQTALLAIVLASRLSNNGVGAGKCCRKYRGRL